MINIDNNINYQLIKSEQKFIFKFLQSHSYIYLFFSKMLKLQLPNRNEYQIIHKKKNIHSPSLSNFKLDHYIIGSKIGAGGFATVYRAIQQYTDTEVAIKVIEFSELAPQHKSRLQNQVEIHKRLDHPSIVKIYEAIWTPTRLFIVMELVKGKELFEYLCENGPLSEQKSVVVFSQIVSAVKYLHEMGIAHRDIKAENVMLDSKFNAKLVDFGLAKEFGTEKEIMFQTFCGSRSYIAPEIVDRLSYSGRQVDVWALGVTLYVMMEAALPFDYDNKVPLNIKNHDWEVPKFSSNQAIDLYESIFRDRKKRINLQQIMKHSLFKKYNILFRQETQRVSFHQSLVSRGRLLSISKFLRIKQREFEQCSKDENFNRNQWLNRILNNQERENLYKNKTNLRNSSSKNPERLRSNFKSCKKTEKDLNDKQLPQIKMIQRDKQNWDKANKAGLQPIDPKNKNYLRVVNIFRRQENINFDLGKMSERKHKISKLTQDYFYTRKIYI